MFNLLLLFVCTELWMLRHKWCWRRWMKEKSSESWKVSLVSHTDFPRGCQVWLLIGKDWWKLTFKHLNIISNNYINFWDCLDMIHFIMITIINNWASEVRLSLMNLNWDFDIYIYIYMAKFKESMHVHPWRLLKNVNISMGARNLRENALK